MKKLSIVAFSRNNFDMVMQFVRDLDDIADEIVVVDSSDGKEKRRLDYAAKKTRKLKVYHTIAIGYPDPLFMYGIGKCANDWVLYLDLDERLSTNLHKKIRGMISSATKPVIAIRRYEEVTKESRGKSFTWQVHLFKKGAVEFKGLIHEQPKVRGGIQIVEDDDLYMEHVVELMEHEKMEYHRMEKYERFSYRQYNTRVLDYVSKATVWSRGAGSRLLSRVTEGWLRFYEAITFRNPDNEISNFDYFFLRLFMNVGYSAKAHDIGSLLDALPSAARYIRRLRAWRNEPDGDENFEIAEIINDVGITKFLHLDDERHIQLMNREYADKKQGLGLLMELLTAQYRAQRRQKR